MLLRDLIDNLEPDWLPGHPLVLNSIDLLDGSLQWFAWLGGLVLVWKWRQLGCYQVHIELVFQHLAQIFVIVWVHRCHLLWMHLSLGECKFGSLLSVTLWLWRLQSLHSFGWRFGVIVRNMDSRPAFWSSSSRQSLLIANLHGVGFIL